MSKPEVDLAKAALVLNMLKDDAPTASYVTGCLLHGFAIRILHDVGRPHDEILTSTVATLEAYDSQSNPVQEQPSA